ncbi:hypothetical protein Tco_0823309 [Tanacetum coccineum]|uniref:Uncharacterized protein n=1 Tax=Tanacetum coccineum TaxID=301880 RepID=A0ABQ5AHK2_9ASTR
MCVVHIGGYVNATPTVKIVRIKGSRFGNQKGFGKQQANYLLNVGYHGDPQERKFTSENLIWFINGDPQEEISLGGTNHPLVSESSYSKLDLVGMVGFLSTYSHWSNQEARSTAISTTEAEYIAMSGCCAQIAVGMHHNSKTNLIRENDLMVIDDPVCQVRRCLQLRELKACDYKFLSKHILDQVQMNPEIPVKAVQDSSGQTIQSSSVHAKGLKGKEQGKKKLPGATVRINVQTTTNPTLPTKCLYEGSLAWSTSNCCGYDGNNGTYPLAYAVFEAKTKESWIWFLQCLSYDLGLKENLNFAFISDKQKLQGGWGRQNGQASYSLAELRKSGCGSVLNDRFSLDNCPAHPKIIEGLRNVEDVLTHPEKNVVAQLLTDEEIIESVIGINKDDIDEEDDESSTMEPPSRNEAIKAAITLNNFLLSYEKTTPEVLTMLRKIRDEIQGEIDFNKKQKTIESFFKKPS